jgi:hypothetical protein
MFDNLYCKIYVNTDKNIDELSSEIEKIISIESDEFHSFESEDFTLDVLRNKEYDENKCNEFPDGFLYFNFNLEIDCNDTNKENEYIEFVSTLMKSLWGLGMRLVASCDFEEVLPNQGGFNNRINY